MKKVVAIFINSVPTFLMIGLIPLIHNDYLLMIIYIVLIAAALKIRYEKNDLTLLIFGFVIMIVCEYIFISTGVETFVRNSLFGVMPIWLPFLWGYGFVAIKRSVAII